MSSDLENAWAAGLIDGDGCITFIRSKIGFGKPSLVVDSTDPEILAELLRLYGGSLVTKKVYKAHHRQAHSWRVAGARNIARVLVQVHPYMHCAFKRERARMILEDYPLVTASNGHYTAETRAVKAAWVERFMALGTGRGSRAVDQTGKVSA